MQNQIPDYLLVWKRKILIYGIRLTERQVKRLAEVLLEKQKNKSVIVRDALDNYLDETDKSHDTQTPKAY